MVTAVSVARVGALVGDPARAAMLQALMDGRALTAAELARAAGVTPQTASGHLAQLAAARLLAVAKQGRHRYHRLATPQVARLLEGLMLAAADAAGPRAPAPRGGPRDARLRLARTCYDHVAGWLGVGLADALAARGWVEVADDAALVTPGGLHGLAALGIDLDAGVGRARPLCRPCLDWSERRPHLAGRLGAALCAHCLRRGWVRTRPGSRALDVTPAGWTALDAAFGVRRPPDAG